ncbi:MAG: hypothetical protein SGBAC_013183 [Bacillariaceae sp.]
MGIFMPNGIALSHDQKHLIIVAGVQGLKYSLEAQAMGSEPFIYAMPGTGDNLHTANRLPTGEPAQRDVWEVVLKVNIGALVPYKTFVVAIPKFSALAVFDGATGELIEMYRDESNLAHWLSEATILGEYLYLVAWFNIYLARVKVEDLK